MQEKNQIILINGKRYKPFDDMYLISEDGDIYSKYSHKNIKWNITIDGHARVNIHGKHKFVAHLVLLTWITDKIPHDAVVRHLDDNKLNNNYHNLCLETQKDNIKDCFDNNHRVGNIMYLTVLDKEINEIITFCPAKDFIPYSKHTCNNGSVKRMFNKNWFKKQYDIISYGAIKNLQQFLELKGVTTIDDECSQVG